MNKQFQTSALAPQRTQTMALLVAGMHRSGTSALSRVLSMLGAELPRTLMRPGFDNPKGFWESEPIAAYNETLLVDMGVSWDEVISYLAPRDELALRQDIVAGAREALRAEYSLSRPLVIKEPRISLLLKVWLAALEQESCSARVIIPVRNPLEVCASLGARSGFSVGRSLLLWLAYVLEAERASRGTPRVIVRYDDLLLDWRGLMRRCENDLDVRFSGWTPAAELEIDAFLSTADRHHISPPDLLQARADVVDWVKRVYAWMSDAALGVEGATAELDSIARDFEASLRIFAPLIAERGLALKSLSSELSAVRRETLDLTAKAEAARADLDASRVGAAEIAERAAQAEAALQLEADARAAAETDREALRTQIAVLEGERTAHQAELAAACKQRDELAAELEAGLAAAQAEVAETRAAYADAQESIKAVESAARAAEAEVNLRKEREGIAEARLRELTTLAQELELQLGAELAQMRSEHDAHVEVRKAEQQLRAELAQMRSEHDAHMEEMKAEHARSKEEQARAMEESARWRGAHEARADDLVAVVGRVDRLRDALQKASQTAERLARWANHPAPSKRAAYLLRDPVLRPFLRAHYAGRAAALLASGLYIPQDGPGGRAVVAYARGRGGFAHPLFDDQWYARSGGQRESCAALDYLFYGDERNANPHPLFDNAWYRSRYKDQLVGWRLTALEHYIMRGAQAGMCPHPLFDTNFYVPQARAVYERRVNPLAHYLREGWREELDPHPLFSTRWYYEKYPDVRDAGVPALVHYVTTGALEGRDPHPNFSTSFYLEANPDVKAAGINPLVHYVTQGWRDGRWPSRDFDPRAYLSNNPDIAADIEPLAHFLAYGAPVDPTPRGAIHVQDASAAPMQAAVPTNNAASAATAFDKFSVLSGELADNYSWPTYERLTSAIRQDTRAKIEAFKPRAGQLLDFSNKDLAAVARSLKFSQPAQPEVSIIIPVYGQLRYTLECLASLAASGIDTTFEVIILDDASTDETPRVAPTIEGLRYVRNDENLGYLRSVNHAATFARGDTLVILNNDTQVERGWLRPLLEALRDPTVGIAAPKMLFPNGRLQEAGAKLKADGTAVMIGLFEDPDLPRYCYDRDVDYVSGACVALRRADFAALNGFDDRFAPAYCEDSDLCMRIRDAGKRVRYVASSQIYHHLSISSDALPNAYKMRQVRKNQQQMVERWSEALDELNRVRVISFYLPQFHAIPENDRWWGPGFTEWRNVTRALPNFEGHYQPHRPAELGYYDLTHPETMERQAELARAHGVSGFCYYYYWFAGKRVLEAPLERLVATGKPDFPFCICWANENWTRTWDGQHKDVLLAQHYSDEDDRAIVADMIRYMRMPSYIRINGKPLLVVYRPQLFPNPQRTAETWRRACREAGIGEIYLAMAEVFEQALTYTKPSTFGFDASIEFPPSGMSAGMNPGPKLNPRFTGVVSDYNEIALRYLKEPIPGHTRFRGVMPSWDNTARRQDVSYVFQNATPGAFQAWLEAVVEQTRLQNFGDERIVFVNAWNEWAEGAHLEPDLRFGRGWLEAVRNAQLADLQLNRRDP